MKNLIFGLLVIIMAATSCASGRRVQATVATRNVTAPVFAVTVADLEVSPQKISYTYQPKANMIFSGMNEVVSLAISEALKVYGDADVLVETQSTITTKLDGSNKIIESVTVSGYPAKYKNFRNVDNETLNKAIENGTLLPYSQTEIVNIKTENNSILKR